jgi:RNA polymerase sigma-70 factor, ECF subfamily
MKFSAPRGNKMASGSIIVPMDDCVPNERSAFEELMLPHLDAAYNLARWLLRHEQDAEDAVQDAFLRAHRGFSRFTGADGRAWLLTIVRNVCYTRLRDEKRHGTAEAFDDEAHSAMLGAGEANAVAWREVKTAQLQQALENLAPEFREVIVLHEIERLSYREIGEVAKLPIGTVMSRLSRARQKLQTELLALAAQEPTHGL